MSVADPIPAAEELKLCCANAYQRDAVALILGDSYHPGGLGLTRRLAGHSRSRRGERVLDVASGPGTTAFLLAAEFGVAVEGVDLGDQAVAAANAKAAEQGLDDVAQFHVGDAERLPLPDESVDAVVCECAFCTFPDKATAAAEMARVLKPGGRIGITDVALDPKRLDVELQSLAGWVACLADARPVDEYVQLLASSGARRHDARVPRRRTGTDDRPDRRAGSGPSISQRLPRSPTLTSSSRSGARRTRRARFETESWATPCW